MICDVELSDAQKTAVEYLEGPQIILAGAGSGKTRVIVAKAQYLVEQKEHAPDSLLVLTYSNKTQAELEERMADLGGSAPDVSTFHSFGLEILNEFGNLLGISGDVVKADEFTLYRYLMRAIGELTDSILLRGGRPDSVYGDLRRFIDRAKDELATPFEVVKKAEEELKTLPDDADDDETVISRDRWRKILEAGKIFQSYERIKSEGAGTGTSQIDYGDMIVLSHALLKFEKIVGATLRQRIKYILVDEFQDANFAQVEILHLLAGDSCGITVVGDDDQAIYRFRGASFGSFKLFEKLFENCVTHRLEENYRSTKNIVTAAQAVIEENGEGRFDPDKKMFSSGEDGEKVYARLCADYETEAHSIAAEVKALLENETYQKPRSIAVLFRARRHKALLEKILTRQGIDYSYDKKSAESSSPAARLLMALYEFSIDHARIDHLAYLIHHFAQEISVSEEREILYRLSRTEEDPLDELKSIAGDYPETVSSEITKLLDFLTYFSEIRNVKPPLEFLETIIWKAEILSPLIIDGQISDERAVKEVAGILRSAEAFGAGDETGTHAAFLEYLGWREGFSEADSDGEGTESPVILQTIHGSKGLEYPVVFVMGLSGGRFPSKRQSSAVEFPPELYKDEIPEGDIRLLEERRLFYVAMTRAKERLYLYGVERKGTRRSQFLKELLGTTEFDEVGAKETVEEMRIDVIPEIGPSRARDESKSVIISGSLPIEKSINEGLHELWNMEKSKATGKEDFDKIREEFRSSMDNAVGSVKSEIDGESYSAEEKQTRYQADKISYTDLEAFADCPLKFYYGKVLRLPTPSTPPQILGQTIHRTLEWAAKSEMDGIKPDLDLLTGDFENRWKKIRFADPDQKERMRQRGTELLAEYIKMDSEIESEPFELEKVFEVGLESAKLTGRIDRIDKIESGLLVIDYKTGKKDEKKLRKDLQLPIYSLACKELYNEYPSETMYMFLGDGEPHKQPSDPESLDGVRSEIEERIKAINESSFTATPGSACRLCEFGRICPARAE